MLVWKRVQLEMKAALQSSDSLEATTLGLGNDYLSKTTSFWNILWLALSGTLLEFARARETSMGLE